MISKSRIKASSLSLQTQNYDNDPAYDGIQFIELNQQLKIVNKYSKGVTGNLQFYLLPDGSYITKYIRAAQLEINHYDTHGNVKEIVLNQNRKYQSAQLQIITKEEIIMMVHSYQRGKCFTDIIQWNFINNTKMIIPLRKSSHQKQISFRLFTFPDSKLFCICQSSLSSQFNNRNVNIKLTYFRYPLQSLESQSQFQFQYLLQKKPIHIYQTQMANISNINAVHQFDSYSGVCLIGVNKNSVQSQFYVYSLSDDYSNQNQYYNKKYNQKEKFRKFQFKFDLQIDREYFTADILQIWSPKKNVVYIKYVLRVNQSNLTAKMRQKLPVINNKVNQNKQARKVQTLQKPTTPQILTSVAKHNPIYKQAQQKYYSKQRCHHFVWQLDKDKATQINLSKYPTYNNYAAIQFTNRLRNINIQFVNPQKISDRLIFDPYQMRKPHDRLVTMLPIFYIDVDKLDIKKADFSKQKLYYYKSQGSQMCWNCPNYDDGTVFQFYRLWSDLKNHVEINKTKVRELPYCISTVTAHLIVSICDQVDDDLLCSAVQLIVN